MAIDEIRLHTIPLSPFSPKALILLHETRETWLKNDNCATPSIKVWEDIKMETEMACKVKVKIYLKSELPEVIENVMDNYLHVCTFQAVIDTSSKAITLHANMYH